MTGGLLQIVTSGKQDIYLTINPEITFFKKVYRRHTNFSLELVEIISEQPAEFNNSISFIINKGDAIHRCYLEIELPNLSFSDKYVTDPRYVTRKGTHFNNLTSIMNNWSDYYNNLKGFVDIEIQLYINLHNLLQTTNISITSLKNEVDRFNYTNKLTKDLYINKIEDSVFILIDMSGYINSINKLITNLVFYDETTYISKDIIIQNLLTMYNNMNNFLSYYNNKKNNYLNQINKLNQPNQINFNYAEYLGHNYFSSISLEIGGIQFDKYENDIYHINQMHAIKQENMPNYLEMIGNTAKLNTFNNSSKGNTKILVPLMFWFNKDAGSSLPIVALQYSNIVINAKIADISKIICFENYEQMFDEIITLEIENDNSRFILNTNLIYTDYTYNLKNKSIIYNCLFINDELLKIKYPDLTDQDIQTILENNGTIYTLNQVTSLLNSSLTELEIQNLNGPNGVNTTYLLINKYQWVSFMINITNLIYVNIAPKVGSYYPYINFNLYYGLINNPKIKLITECIFLDDVERAKFANSKLEYVVETFESDIYTIRNQDFFDCELSFNNPCKELYWYIQPQIFKDGLTENGQNISLLFDTFKYFTNSLISNQKLTFNQLDLLLNNVDLNYYTYMLSYKFLNNILPNGIYYNSFSLYPEESQPSGTANLKQIKSKQYRIQFDKNFLKEYTTFLNNIYNNTPALISNKNSFILKFIAKSYDLLVIHKGNAKLMFSTS